jgi:hypothetical protein
MRAAQEAAAPGRGGQSFRSVVPQSYPRLAAPCFHCYFYYSCVANSMSDSEPDLGLASHILDHPAIC